MEKVIYQFGRWEVECRPSDGGRLSMLRFSGFELLTRSPASFQAPQRDYGEYETRPVYGYDDCFPSIKACSIPNAGWPRIRDHGEVCWLNWDVRPAENRLDCRTRSEVVPEIQLRRSLFFGSTSITWEFEVSNAGDKAIPFMHVTHPLMPLEQVVDLRLPRSVRVVNERTGDLLDTGQFHDCRDFLLKGPSGRAVMVLLEELIDNQVDVMMEGGLTLEIRFPAELFPTLGIWWNNAGYPDETGCRRIECAFEPIPGKSCSLAEVHSQGDFLSVAPGDKRTWEITWNIRQT